MHIEFGIGTRLQPGRGGRVGSGESGGGEPGNWDTAVEKFNKVVLQFCLIAETLRHPMGLVGIRRCQASCYTY